MLHSAALVYRDEHMASPERLSWKGPDRATRGGWLGVTASVLEATASDLENY